jgi:hypothetical protein
MFFNTPKCNHRGAVGYDSQCNWILASPIALLPKKKIDPDPQIPGFPDHATIRNIFQ